MASAGGGMMNMIPEIWAARYAEMVLNRQDSPMRRLVERKRRTWRERLFSRPWNPGRKYESAESEPVSMVSDRVTIRMMPDILTLDSRLDDVDAIRAAKEVMARLRAEVI